MTTSGTINSDNEAITNVFTSYTNIMNGLDSIWKGASKDNAVTQANEFVETYQKPINEQMTNLASAADLAAIYVEKKKELARLEALLARTTDPEARAAIEAKIQALKAEIAKLKSQIEGILGGISGLIINNPAKKLLNAAALVSDRMNTEGDKTKYSLKNLTSENIQKAANHDYTCCATYVNVALYEAGLLTEEEANSFNYNYTVATHNFLKNKGYETISSYDDLEAGDIVFMKRTGVVGIGHAQIYAGDGYWYNAGSDKRIADQKYRDVSSSVRNRFITALRITE